MTIFRDRTDAGKRLAEALSTQENRSNAVVLALPRGGVPVGFEVAKALHARLDAFMVRKLGAPGHEELAMGAIASGGVVVWNEDVLRDLNISESTKDRVLARERGILQQRESSYRGDRPAVEIPGKTVILVDDGLATGASMRAAVSAVRSRRPARLIIAVPTAPQETCKAFKAIADQVVCLTTPRPFSAVGLWYSDFSQTTDEEVRQLLDQAEDLFHDRPLRPETGGEHGLEPWAAG